MTVSQLYVQEMVRAMRLRPVRIWLYVLAFMVLLMVALGGFTRLTDSGLSITSWKPISGVMPPVTAADWQAEFDAYKQIPEFQYQNRWMTLDDFKLIFWPEWAHRLFGRAIGLAFAIPFGVFLFQRRLDRRLAVPLLVLFVAGGLQGVLGWWMVSSGLSARVDVSQYRLAAHLTAAVVLFAAIIWVARSLEPPKRGTRVTRGWMLSVAALGVLVGIQIVAGAFVAGLDAGMGYTSWPLMEGKFVPDGLFALVPWWKSAFEDALTVQFLHRTIAYVILLFTVGLVVGGIRSARTSGVHDWIAVIGVVVLCQVLLGIATLLSAVALPLALGHQTLALILAGCIAAYLSDMKRSTVI